MYNLKDTIDEVVDDLVEAAEDYLKEIDELINVVKNPEKLIGKKYEEMTQEDFQMIFQIKGKEFFDNWFFNKQYDEVKELEES